MNAHFGFDVGPCYHLGDGRVQVGEKKSVYVCIKSADCSMADLLNGIDLGDGLLLIPEGDA